MSRSESMADLRPMNFGEVLDASLSIFRRHFGLFLHLSVVVMGVPMAVFVYFTTRLEADFRIRPIATMLTLVPVLLVYYLASLVLTAATVRVISDSYLGREPRFRDAIGLGMGRIWPLFLVGLGKSVLLGLIVIGVGIVGAVLVPVARSALVVGVLGGAALIIGGMWFLIYVACGYGVTTPVVVLEELPSAFDAFARSWELTRGSKLRVLGFALVAFLLFNSIPSGVLQAIAAAIQERSPVIGLFAMVLAHAIPMLLLPIISCVFTLMYYDLRVRREAFDLQILGQQLGIV
ncbi:MAG: hypothetical protein ACREMR_00990 [Gemmatimonadales bacterium]